MFCGSRTGSEPAFGEATKVIIEAFADDGWDFVYGGAGVGLMNLVAETGLAKGRHVTGILPEVLFDYEVRHEGISEMIEVADMHVRKRLMTDLSDAFLVLPGGLGTMDEFFENLTWRQLGIHGKPCALFDVDGYYQPLLQFLDRTVELGFVDRKQIDRVFVSNKVDDVVTEIGRRVPPR